MLYYFKSLLLAAAFTKSNGVKPTMKKVGGPPEMG